MPRADEERKTRVAELYLQGFRQYQIADRLGCSEASVSRDVDELRDVWKRLRQEERLERIAEGLAKLDLLESVAWGTGNWRAVLKCLDMRFRVLGAYKPDMLVVQTVPWDRIAGCDADGGQPDIDETLEAETRQLKPPGVNGNGYLKGE